MKKHIIYFVIVFFLFTGCSTFMNLLSSKPASINEAYLKEMSKEDSEKLQKLEDRIISKKKEKDKADKDLSIANQKIVVYEKEISQIEATKILLQEKEKFYTQSKDIDKLAEMQGKLKECEEKNKNINNCLRISEAELEETEILLEVKNAELAVKVAELDYEKAKIAKKFQSKSPEKFGKDIIDDKEYEEFLNGRISILKEKKEEHKKAAAAVEKNRAPNKEVAK